MSLSSVYQNIGQMFSELSKSSTWHADRARRILDSGCPKERVREICAEQAYFARDQLIELEEKKLHLFPMVMSGSFNPPALQTEQHAIMVGEYRKMEYQVGHQARVIERMKEREEWFQERITQLEKFGSTVATELSEMKKKHPEPPPPPPPPSADGRPSPLILKNSEDAASLCRKSVLAEENMVGGMTPTLPLLPIPTHSLKKQVSWHEILEAEGGEAAEVEETCRDSEFFVYSEEGASTHRPSVGGAGPLI
jgi:hypothetical protein